MTKGLRIALPAAVAAVFVVSTHAIAVDNALQLLSGGNSQPENGTSYTAPGMANQFPLDFPGLGEGKIAGSIRMPSKAKVSKLRVLVRTQLVPVSGSLTLTVLKNGNATNMKCSLNGDGTCNSNNTVSLAGGDRLGIEVKNNFNAAGFITYSYTMLMD